MRPSFDPQQARIQLTNSSSSSLDNQRVTSDLSDDSAYISVRTDGFAFSIIKLSDAVLQLSSPPACSPLTVPRAASYPASASPSPFLNDCSPHSPEPHASPTMTTTRGTPRTLLEPPRAPSTTTAMGMHLPTPSRARPQRRRWGGGHLTNATPTHVRHQ